MASILTIPHPDIRDLPRTSFGGDEAAAQTTLTVVNGLAFAANDLVVVNGFGNANSELGQISSTAPTATVIVLSSGLNHSHVTGETIQKTYFNQVAIEYSTDFETAWDTGAYATISDASDAATWTALVTTDLEPDQNETVYQDTSTASRSYRTRYYNSQSALYSSYNDPILPDGFEIPSVGYIINQALNETGKKIDKEDGGQINEEFLLDQINRCIGLIDNKRKRWSWNQVMDAVVSEITSGQQDYLLPTNIDFDKTKRAAYNVRVNDDENLYYVDKRELDDLMEGSHNSELSAELTTTSTTATFDDTSDFDDDGSFTVTTGSTQDTVSYDSNNRTTNVLTLSSTTGVSTTHAVDADVWQSANFGTPKYWTIFERKLYIWPLLDTDLYQRTIKMDYYKKQTRIDSFNDYMLFPHTNLVVEYLCLGIHRKLRNDGDADRYEARFKEQLDDLIRLEVTGQKRSWTLRLNHGGSRDARRLLPTKKYTGDE